MSWREQTKENPHFCIMAFDHMHVNTNGNVNLCCVADWKYPIRADAHGTDLQTLWTGDAYKQIRQDMLDGKAVKQCEGCYKIDREGGGSDRTVHNRYSKVPDSDELNIETGNEQHGPLWVDWRPGRFCNFGCRMCFVGVSSTVADEHKANPELQDVTGESWFDVKDWIEDPVLFESAKSLLPSLKTLKIAGGEPFFMPGVIKLLRHCIEDNQTHLHLDITTNGSRMQGKVLRWLESFSELDIQFSIDGVGYTNDYIRYKADWKALDSAYKQYLTMPVRTHILSTVQAYNAYDLTSIIQYWMDNGSNNNLIFNFVDSPHDLSIDILPLADRIQISKDITKLTVNMDEHMLEQSRINALHVKLNKAEPHNVDVLRQQFAQRTAAYDALRHQDVNLVHTRLGELTAQWLTTTN